jgi:tRNA pseudouridine(55) synthase
VTEKVLNLYKKEGETPLQCLDRFRAENPEYKDIPLSYVGRLDPMAEGMLLVVAGEENKNREAYLGLPKEYECEILFGFNTDTYDILGLVTDTAPKLPDSNIIHTFAEQNLKNFIGTYAQNYPPYSSKPVSGKSLFAHAREGTLDTIDMPSHEVSVSDIEILGPSTLGSLRAGWKFISLSDLQSSIEKRISAVSGDFRQDKILAKWSEVLDRRTEKSFPILKLHISSGSGFYVRTFAYDLGKKIGVPALAFSIKRTKVGEYKIKENIV